MVVASKFEKQEGVGRPAHEVQLTYKEVRLEEEYPKEEAWKTRTPKLTLFEVNPKRWAFTRRNSFRIRSMPGGYEVIPSKPPLQEEAQATG